MKEGQSDGNEWLSAGRRRQSQSPGFIIHRWICDSNLLGHFLHHAVRLKYLRIWSAYRPHRRKGMTLLPYSKWITVTHFSDHVSNDSNLLLFYFSQEK